MTPEVKKICSTCKNRFDCPFSSLLDLKILVLCCCTLREELLMKPARAKVEKDIPGNGDDARLYLIKQFREQPKN